MIAKCLSSCILPASLSRATISSLECILGFWTSVVVKGLVVRVTGD